MASKLIMPSTPFDFCNRQRIVIPCFQGEDEEVMAWTYEDYAAHGIIGSDEHFTISRLSNGLGLSSLGAIFRTLETTVRAMLEIASTIDGKVTDHQLAFFEICKKHDCIFRDLEQLHGFVKLQAYRGAFDHDLHKKGN